MAKENSKQELGALAAQACVQRPRERIVASAQDLFHRHGIRGVGVDTIAEAAGTNKMTLYRHFGSKDELIPNISPIRERNPDEIGPRSAENQTTRRPVYRLCRRPRNSLPRTSAGATSLTPRSS